MATIAALVIGFYCIGVLLGSWIGWKYATWLIAGVLAEQHLKIDERGRIAVDYDNHALAE